MPIWFPLFPVSTMDVAFYKVDKAISIYDALGEYLSGLESVCQTFFIWASSVGLGDV